ncbi:hypothetical protein D9M70_468050 [compost metagenome]
MCAIGASTIQADFGIACQLKLSRFLTLIAEFQQTHLGIAIQCDRHVPSKIDVSEQTAILGTITVKRVFVDRIRMADRLPANRPDLAALKVADVAELAPAIACAVLTPTRDVEAAPGFIPGTGLGQKHVVVPIRKQDRVRRHACRTCRTDVNLASWPDHQTDPSLRATHCHPQSTSWASPVAHPERPISNR